MGLGPPKIVLDLVQNMQKYNSNNVSILLDSVSLISTMVILYFVFLVQFL